MVGSDVEVREIDGAFLGVHRMKRKRLAGLLHTSTSFSFIMTLEQARHNPRTP